MGIRLMRERVRSRLSPNAASAATAAPLYVASVRITCFLHMRAAGGPPTPDSPSARRSNFRAVLRMARHAHGDLVSSVATDAVEFSPRTEMFHSPPPNPDGGRYGGYSPKCVGTSAGLMVAGA